MCEKRRKALKQEITEGGGIKTPPQKKEKRGGGSHKVDLHIAVLC